MSYQLYQKQFRSRLAEDIASGARVMSQGSMISADRCGYGSKPFFAGQRLLDRAQTISELGRRGLAESVRSGRARLCFHR